MAETSHARNSLTSEIELVRLLDRLHAARHVIARLQSRASRTFQAIWRSPYGPELADWCLACLDLALNLRT